MPSDELLIQQLLNLYGLAVDGRRWDLFADIFAEDVRADYGEGGVWDLRETFVSDFARLHERYDHTLHAVSNHVITVDGDVAGAFSYVSWRLASLSDDGWRGREGNAWYDDELARTDAGWRITSRRCRVTWSRPVTGEEPPARAPDVPRAFLALPRRPRGGVSGR